MLYNIIYLFSKYINKMLDLLNTILLIMNKILSIYFLYNCIKITNYILLGPRQYFQKINDYFQKISDVLYID